MKIAALFLWLALPLAGYAIYLTHDTPHVIWSYARRVCDDIQQGDTMPFYRAHNDAGGALAEIRLNKPVEKRLI